MALARKKRITIIVAGIVAGFVVVLSVIVYSQYSKGESERLFWDALDRSLGTKNYTMYEEGWRGNYYLNADVSDPAHTRAYAYTVPNPRSDSILVKQVFSTFEDAYVRALPAPSTSVKSGQWLTVRSQGVDKGARALVMGYDTLGVTFSQFVMGNYPNDMKQKILQKIKDVKPYSYDTSKVTTETIQGEKVLVYPIEINVDKIVEVNRYVAQLIGVQAPNWEYIISDKVTQEKVYITKSTGRIARISEVYGRWNSFEDAKKYGSTRVVDFKDYGYTDVITKDQLKGLQNN